MALSVGTKAPDFTLPTKTADGPKQITLSDRFIDLIEEGFDVTLRIAETVDEQAYPSRHGGEEFMIAFSGLAQSEAWERCERLRRELDQLRVRLDNGEVLGSTASIGLSRARLGATPDELLREADEQLYRAKAAGRNRVYSAD